MTLVKAGTNLLVPMSHELARLAPRLQSLRLERGCRRKPLRPMSDSRQFLTFRQPSWRRRHDGHDCRLRTADLRVFSPPAVMARRWRAAWRAFAC